MSFPKHRHRRLRRSKEIRNLVAETAIRTEDFIVPIFVTEGLKKTEPINAMPGYFRYSLDRLCKEVAECMHLGLKSFILFAMVPDSKKDNEGKEALNENGLFPKAIRRLKDEFPEMALFSDIALDPYSEYGHDGIVIGERIDNDSTLEVLNKMSLMHAASGVDFLAPSDMMDGRVAAIRTSLDSAGYSETGIMSYSAKYASSFYGPFRDALNSAPGFGDKSAYQMDFRNAREAIKECLSDVDEGADIVMIKPALPYLDIITKVKDKVNVPVAAYQVSGEYSMIKAAAQKGWVDESKAVMESLISIKRAGADIIASYFTKTIAKELKMENGKLRMPE